MVNVSDQWTAKQKVLYKYRQLQILIANICSSRWRRSPVCDSCASVCRIHWDNRRELRELDVEAYRVLLQGNEFSQAKMKSRTRRTENGTIESTGHWFTLTGFEKMSEWRELRIWIGKETEGILETRESFVRRAMSNENLLEASSRSGSSRHNHWLAVVSMRVTLDRSAGYVREVDCSLWS